ncbi:COBW domain-containing protein 1 [Tanacetum coccineum]
MLMQGIYNKYKHLRFPSDWTLGSQSGKDGVPLHRKQRLDHILLETTGLANPTSLTSLLWPDNQLEASVKLDSIITASLSLGL